MNYLHNIFISIEDATHKLFNEFGIDNFNEISRWYELKF